MHPHELPSQKCLVESDVPLRPLNYSLEKFKLYETRAMFYLIGRDKSRTRWKILKIDRSDPTELNVYEDPVIYTRQDCNDLLNRLAAGNQSTGGLKFVAKAYGVVGFIKFLEPYYMILVTKRRMIGTICGHAVYGIDESQLVTVSEPSSQMDITWAKAENRYKKLFMSIDLSKDFFYSYTYRIMWTLQRNVCMGQLDRIPYDDMFVWNAFLTRGICQQLKSFCFDWTIALVHGFFKQAKLPLCDGMDFTLTLIARRSRHFAGTRYMKRGVNDKGRVANDVETEQVVHVEPWDELRKISAVVQHRGSIPLFWSQETSVLSPKPDIILHEHDPTYEATRLHFQNLAARYGHPIIVLNLVKTVEKKPRETILCREFANGVAYLNHLLPKGNRIKFIQWDFHMFAKSASANILEVLESIATDVLDRVGFYHSGKTTASANNHDLTATSKEQDDDICLAETEEGEGFQQGILRSNCIDCLDRTNVAQYAFGLAALGRQLHALDLHDLPHIDSDSNLAAMLMKLYEDMGDALAIQYGGSAAHNSVFSQRQGRWKATTQSRKLIRSIRRHYNNAYVDGEKQDGINIFLGHFRPEKGKPALWQLDSDHHLHIRRSGGDDPMNDRLSFKRSFSTGNMIEQNKIGSLSSPALKEDNFLKLTLVKNAAQAASGLPRFFTDSELELKGAVESDLSKESLDVMYGDECLLPVYNTHKVPYKAGQGVGYSVDIDWLSSSGNSCEDDATDRHSVAAADIESCCGPFPKLTGEAEAHEDNFYYYQGMPGPLEHRVDTEVKDVLQKYHGSDCDIVSEVPLKSFSRTFVDWIYTGQTLCH